MSLDRALRPLPERSFGFDEARHLLARAGFGGTPEQVRAIADLGLDDAVDYLVEWDAIPDPVVEADEFDRDIRRPPSEAERRLAREARRTEDQVLLDQLQQERQRRDREDRRQFDELRRWWLARMLETGRPLQERLTLFWHGHFATGYREIRDSWMLFRQNQFLRANAAGNFADLVHGIVRDPAMLKYLNNDRNVRRSPNENLARELMELFTLGEGRGYTERDIKEAARALTGHTVLDDEFRFASQVHDPGAKTILGRSGTFDGAGLVDLLLSQRACSEFIALKLYRHFVNDLPGGLDAAAPEARAAVDEMAGLLRRHRYELRPVLGRLFRSRHFQDPANAGTVVKSPIELIVSSIRTLGLPVRPLSVLLSAADMMGQSLFQPPTVEGWPGGRSWINTSTLFVRQNLLVYLVTGRSPSGLSIPADDAAFDPMPLVGSLADSRGLADADGVRDAAARLLRFCLGGEPHPQRVEAVEGLLADVGDRLDRDRALALVCLVTAMPEYQLA
jgi:uncharacterized protein (DUF1800 family)